MTVLISEHARLYQNDVTDTEALISQQKRQSFIQRSKVEWLSQEDTDHTSCSATGLKTSEEKPQSSTSSSEVKQAALIPIGTSEKGGDTQIEERCKKMGEDLDGKTEEKGGSDVAGSPSKQSKAPPSWRSSFKGSAASGGTRGKIGGSAGDVSAAGGSNWLMNGLSSLRAHRRTTSSGERLKDSALSLKDSTLSLKETTRSVKDSQKDSDEDSSRTSLSHRSQSHRMSAYDNVAPSSLSLPADTSVWTSFEISLADPEASDKANKIGQGQGRPAEVKDDTQTQDCSVSGTQDGPVGTNESHANIVTQLKQELKKQRMIYEASIRK